MQKKRILFLAEAATLAHVIRPLVLARALDPERYDVHFAYAKGDLMRGKEFIFEGTDFTHWEIASQSSAVFLDRTATGKPLYALPVLEAYVEEELKLIDKVAPDFIVSDMRWSVPVSAALRNIPYAIVTNAHWSTHALPFLFPLPEYEGLQKAVRILGEKLLTAVFETVKPIGFRVHARPIQQLRRKYKLPAIAHPVTALHGGQHVLYADMAEMVPTAGLPASECYLGPITWAPAMTRPDWWDRIPADRPIAYVALGSSGNAALLPEILAQLTGRGMTVIAAAPANLSREHVFAAPYFPWGEAAKRAVLMVSNGGTGAIYQAVEAGIPLLGIVSNQDQLMGMSHAGRWGVGTMLRSSAANAETIGAAIDQLRSDPGYKAAAEKMRHAALSYNAGRSFVKFIEAKLPG